MKKLFVIGDSISCYYGQQLEKMLNGVCQYDRKGGTHHLKDLDDCTDGINGGDSSMVLRYLKEVTASEWFTPDILLLNCGIHDMKRHPQTEAFQIGLQQYTKNLKNIISVSSSKKISIIWVRITPVNKKHYADATSYAEREKAVNDYNDVADRIMKESRIPVIDLFTFSKNLGENIYLNETDSVHFNENAASMQAAFIAGWFYSFLN